MKFTKGMKLQNQGKQIKGVFEQNDSNEETGNNHNTSGHEKLQGGDGEIGFSDRAYYNVLMKGGRVTRGAIRKEEEPQQSSFGGKTALFNKTKFAKTESQDVSKKQKQDENDKDLNKDLIPTLQKHQSYQISKTNNKITALNKQENSTITASENKQITDKNQQKKVGVSQEEVKKPKAADIHKQQKKNLNLDQKDEKISQEGLEAERKARKNLDKSKSLNETLNAKSELQNKITSQTDQSQQTLAQKGFIKKRNEKALQKQEQRQGEENSQLLQNNESVKNIKVQEDSDRDIYEPPDVSRKQAKLNVQQKLQRQEMLLQKIQQDNIASTNKEKPSDQNQQISNIQQTNTQIQEVGSSVDSSHQNQINPYLFMQPVDKQTKSSIKQTDSKQQSQKSQSANKSDLPMKAEQNNNEKTKKIKDSELQRQKEEQILFGENPKEINKNQKVKDAESNKQMQDQVMHIILEQSNIFTEDENYSALPSIQKHEGSKLQQKDNLSRLNIDQDQKNKKTAKKDVFQNNAENIFSQRNQELRERFEYHFPHFQYIENRFVLYGEGIATVEKIDLQKTQSQKNASQILNLGPNDYEKLYTQVKVYQDSPSISMPIKHLKYLSRVYICDLKYINIDLLSDEFKENLSQGDENRRKILIVQVIDNSNRYSEDIDNQNIDIEDLKLKNHPFQFYCIGKEDFEDRVILTGPVQFINQIQDNEIVQITNLKSKVQTTIKQPDSSETNQMEILNSKFDFLKDLYILDDSINQSSFIKHLAYNSAEISNFIIQQSMEINKAFNKYKEKASQVLVNEQNMLNSLFTVCQFDNLEKQRCKGVLTQVKYNKQDKNYYLQFRNIQMKSSQNEKLEWIPLLVNEVSEYFKSKHQDDKILADNQQSHDPNRKQYHIVSEYYRGFVSLDCLKNLDNTYQYGQRLRTKHLYFLSHEISCIQIQRQLNIIFNVSKEQILGDHASNIQFRNQSPAYLQQQTIADDQSKQSFNFSQKNQQSLKNDSQLQLNKNTSGIITKKSSQILSQLKCKKCNIKNEEQVLVCCECDDQWHINCLENKDYEHLCGMGEKQWRCPKCIRCSNCKSMVNNQKLMLICKCCNTPYHFECLDPLMSSYCPPYLSEHNQKWLIDQNLLYSDEIISFPKFQLKNNNIITKNLDQQPNIMLYNLEQLQNIDQHLIFSKVDFKCQYCIECIDCGSKDFGNGTLSRWSQDFNFCQPCYNIRKNNQYCQVCMESQNLKKQILEIPNQNENFKIQAAQNNMIQCFFCNRLVHSYCDFIFQNSKIKKILIDNLMASQQQNKIQQQINYCCQECRDKKRNQLLQYILNQIRVEDKNKFFIDKFWEHFYKQQDKDAYMKAIKSPICLEMIQENINDYKYLDKKNDFKQDILLMFQNAKSFNKQNTLVYQDANKFTLIFTENYQKWQNIIQRQIMAHEIEQKWKKFVHSQEDFQKKYFNIIYTQNNEKEKFFSEIQEIIEWKQTTLPQIVSDESIKEYFIEQEYFQDDIFNLKQQDLKFTLAINKSQDKTQTQQIFESAPLKQTQSQKIQKKQAGDLCDTTQKIKESQQTEKASDKPQNVVQRHHKKLRRGDELSETIIQKDDIAINNSAVVTKSLLTLDKNYEKSAPNEFQIGFDENQSNAKIQQNINQKNELKRSKQIFEDDQNNSLKQTETQDKNINNQIKNKKQKVKDTQEIISDKINSILQLQGQTGNKIEESNTQKQKAKENDKFSFKDNQSGNDRASQNALRVQNDKTDLNSASGTNASMVHQMLNKNKEKSKNKMIDHYQKVDDEGCYYSNPIRCSFDDPKLIFEEMCYLCGSFGNQEDFVTCVLCGESFHTFCLQLQSEDVMGMYQSNWKCLNCKSCEYCGKATNEDLLMFCGICDRPYHSFCLQPEIKNIPEQWKCDFCFKCKQCGTNKYFNENDIKNGLNLTVTDYQLSKNFSLCYDCGQNEYKKQNCSICLEKTTPDMSHNLQILKCRDCGYYSHIQCSRVTIEELQSLLQEYKEKVEKQQKGKPIQNKQKFSIQKIYKCLDCIIKGKSMNFLILESCLHYENIHNLIQRQQFISEICVEILSQYFPEKFRQKAPRFIQKFITNNKDFFRCDEIIVKWLELMETEVSYSKDLYQNTSIADRDTQINQINHSDEKMEELDKNQKQSQFLDKKYWKKYNPFEASKYYFKDQNQEEGNKKFKSAYEYERVIYNIDDKVEDKNIPRAVKTEHSMTAFKTSMLPQKRSMYESLYKGNLNRFHQSGKITPNQNAQQQKLQVMTAEKLEEQKLNAEAENSQPEQCPILQKLTQGTQGESIYLKPNEIQQELYNTNEKREKFVNILLNGLDADEELSSEYLDSDSSEADDQTGEVIHQKHESLSLIEMYMHYELKAIMRIKLQFFKWFEEFFSKTINVFLGGGQYNQQIVQKQNQRSQSQNLLTNEKVQEEDIEMSNQFKDFSSNSDCESVESMVETLEDQLIQNPQINLTCLLCKKKGEYSITGRLIPYKLNIYVHTNCALWTEGVFDIEDGQIINFYQQQKKLINNKCHICNDYGATLICQKHSKGCNKYFHFPCAYSSGKIKFTKNKELFCENCQKIGGRNSNLIINQIDNNQQDINMVANDDQINNMKPIMFPSEYIKKRRLYIVQNVYEVNQIEYENQLENQNQQDEKKINASQSGQSVSAKGHSQNQQNEKMSRSERQKKEKHGDSISYTSHATGKGNSKDIEVNKWRPYYYDFFNRVGNLTVLCMRKEINQIIDVIQQDSSSQGSITNIQSYIQMLQNSAKERNQLMPIQDLDSPKKRGKSGNQSFSNLISLQQNTLLDELYKYLDLFNDYATIRIYWKFYDDNLMKIPAQENSDPRKLKRAYFLYINKSKKIYEIEKNDIKTILEFCSKQIKNNVIIQNNISLFRSENNEQSLLQGQPIEKLNSKSIDDELFIDQNQFWKRTLDHFKSQRPNFSLQNIEFCIEKLFGLAKYPINVWNQQQFTNNDLKHNLNQCKNRLGFFLVSGISILNQMNLVHFGYPYCLTGNNVNSQAANSKDKMNNQADLQQVLTGRVLTLDGVFQRMMKVNNMERYDYDKIISNYSSKNASLNIQIGQNQNQNGWLRSSLRSNNNHNFQLFNRMDQISINQVSSKHMSYDQLMVALGKGRKVDISKISKILEEQKIAHGSKGEAGKQEDIDSFEKRQLRARKKVLEQKQQLQQINFQNQAQQELAEQSANQIGSQNAIKMNKTNLPIAMQYRSAIQMPRKVELGPSKIHRIGLFTNEDLKPLDIVIEYVGEIIKNEVADQREKSYLEKGIGDCYMFRVDDQYIIDATFFGGKARYLNHSCDANCSAKIITVDNQKHIIIRAKKHISAGQELTYNYNFDQEEDKLGCFCGAKNCSGYLA